MTIKLAVFDVDGTLLRGDTLCQTIARGIGRYERMTEFEGASNRDEVIAAREEMAGWYIAAGRDRVTELAGGANLAPGAVEGVGMLRDAGVHVAFASMTWTIALATVASRLGVADYMGTALDFDTGEITHSWSRRKVDYLTDILSDHKLSTAQSAAVGDTGNDVPMLSAAGVGVFVGADNPDEPGIHHMPGADIRSVAELILRARPT